MDQTTTRAHQGQTSDEISKRYGVTGPNYQATATVSGIVTGKSISGTLSWTDHDGNTIQFFHRYTSNL